MAKKIRKINQKYGVNYEFETQESFNTTISAKTFSRTTTSLNSLAKKMKNRLEFYTEKTIPIRVIYNYDPSIKYEECKIQLSSF